MGAILDVKPLTEIDAIIFDMDGTIVLSRDIAIESVHRGAMQMFEKLGIDAPLPDKERILESIGMPSPLYFAALFPSLEPDVRAAIHRRIYELEGELLAQGYGSYAPGAPGALVHLREMGLKLGLASNCGVEYFQSNIEAFSLGDYFDEMLCSGMRAYPEKSVLVREILGKFGTRRALMVGDRVYDIDAAIECGLVPIGCTYGYGTEEELKGASILIDSLDDLVEHLRGQEVAQG